MIDITLFFFNDTATTEIYTLSLHDALPIFREKVEVVEVTSHLPGRLVEGTNLPALQLRHLLGQRGLLDAPCHLQFLLYADRKSTRLNSSHANISYAVFCLKKKNKQLLSGHS